MLHILKGVRVTGEADSVPGKTNMQVLLMEILGIQLPDGELNILRGEVPSHVWVNILLSSVGFRHWKHGSHTHTHFRNDSPGQDTFDWCRITRTLISSLFWYVVQKVDW